MDPSEIDSDIKVFSITSKELTEAYTGLNEDHGFLYYREFEEHGFAKNEAGVEVKLTSPCTMYERYFL